MIYNYYNIDFRTILIFSKGMIYLMLIYDRKILSVLAAAVMLTACGTSETSVSTETNTATSAKTMTTTTVTPTETTTTTLQPETEAEITKETPAVTLKALENSKEITIDDLSNEEREYFENFISENNLSGKFYDHIEMTDDCPLFYFIPSDEYLNYMSTQTPLPYGTEKQLFNTKSIYMVCNADNASEYLYDSKFIDMIKNMIFNYAVMRKRSESEIDNTTIDYFYAALIPNDWQYIGNIFIPDA